MDKQHRASEADGTVSCQTNPCTHSRAIDDVLTRGKKRTGQVRCLECGTIFDDPTRALSDKAGEGGF